MGLRGCQKRPRQRLGQGRGVAPGQGNAQQQHDEGGCGPSQNPRKSGKTAGLPPQRTGRTPSREGGSGLRFLRSPVLERGAEIVIGKRHGWWRMGRREERGAGFSRVRNGAGLNQWKCPRPPLRQRGLDPGKRRGEGLRPGGWATGPKRRGAGCFPRPIPPDERGPAR